MVQHSVLVKGKRTTYWERGADYAPTIVMLHGFRGNHTGLIDVARHFRDCRVIMPDLPGYGESEMLDITHTPAHYAEWLDEFVGALGLKHFISWSHSYSGSIGLIQAACGANRPEAVISVSLASIQRDWLNTMSTLYYQLGSLMPYWLHRRWISSKTVDHATGRWMFHTVTRTRRKELMRRSHKHLPLLNPHVVTEQYMGILNTDLEEYAPNVAMPVLIIAGAKDFIVPLNRLEHLSSLMPDSTLVVMEDQGHLAPLERPATTATISKRFIYGLERSRAS